MLVTEMQAAAAVFVYHEKQEVRAFLDHELVLAPQTMAPGPSVMVVSPRLVHICDVI